MTTPEEKKKESEEEEFQFYQREQGTKWEIFQKTLYDKSTNKILGRTPFSWGQLVVFYVLFYAGLSALFAVCMQGLFATLDDRAPTWTLDRSLIGVNPGVSFRPSSENLEEGTLIWFNNTNHSSIERWTKALDKFLEPYQQNQTEKPFFDCDANKELPSDRVCAVKMKLFGNCIPQKFYGYNSTSPCVFLKLNKIFDWIPQYHTSPIDGMPEELASHIKNSPPDGRKQVWVSCNGVDDFDKENVKGFRYSPHGLPFYYYPYRNAPSYLSPLVAVEILNVTPNVIVSIECRAWAGNIHYQGGTLFRAGSVTFEILVDAVTNRTQPTLYTFKENHKM